MTIPGVVGMLLPFVIVDAGAATVEAVAIPDSPCPGLAEAVTMPVDSLALAEMLKALQQSNLASEHELAGAAHSDADRLGLAVVEARLKLIEGAFEAAIDRLDRWFATASHASEGLLARAELERASVLALIFAKRRSVTNGRLAGDQVDQAQEAIMRTEEDLSPQVRANSLTRLADLLMIFDGHKPANHLYSLSSAMLDVSGASGEHRRSRPVPLCLPPHTGENLVGREAEDQSSLWFDIEFDVKANGEVSRPRVLAHNSNKRLFRVVLESMKFARFRPAFANGKPVHFKDYQMRIVAYGDCDDYRSMGLETDLPVGCY